jgi:hypothetical protein
MQQLRKEDVSLYMYIKDSILSLDYTEVSYNQDLVQDSPGVWTMGFDEQFGEMPGKFPFRRRDRNISGLGRGIPYFDSDGQFVSVGPEQQNRVVVDNGTTTATGCQVNYLDGQIITDQDLTGYTVDYEWNFVSVIDAWPYEDVPALPIVSIELQSGTSLPLQLGGGDIREANWHMEIFASNKGERDDLVDTLYNRIYNQRCLIYTFDNGLPLLRTGLFNPDFTAVLNASYNFLYFEKVQTKLTGLPNWGFYNTEQLNRYRAAITFSTKAYRM